MALGYCRVCERLLPIEPRREKAPGSRQMEWFPVDHDHDGKQCPGVKKPV